MQQEAELLETVAAVIWRCSF